MSQPMMPPTRSQPAFTANLGFQIVDRLPAKGKATAENEFPSPAEAARMLECSSSWLQEMLNEWINVR